MNKYYMADSSSGIQIHDLKDNEVKVLKTSIANRFMKTIFGNEYNSFEELYDDFIKNPKKPIFIERNLSSISEELSTEEFEILQTTWENYKDLL